jgi:hypothetical protein
MLTFKQYLLEVNLSSGKLGDYHAGKYITPYIGQKDTHTLSSDFGNLSVGTKVSVHGHEVINGKHHAKVSIGDSSQQISVPFSKIKKPKQSHKYSDEHAFGLMWNHGINSENFNRDSLHSEIEKAKSDENHPLNINNANANGFSGGKITPQHSSSYYEELHHAADTVSHVANHPDFQDEVKNKIPAKIAGATKDVTRAWERRWRRYGGKDKTSKSDIVIGNNKISYKKGTGSQLMSAQPEEMMSTYLHATKNALKSGEISRDQRKNIRNKLKNVHSLLSQMSSSTPEEKEALKNTAQDHINSIHRDHPTLLNHVYNEAASGRGKFGRNNALSANYLISSSHGGKIPAIKKIEKDNIAEINNNKIPRVAFPKGSNRPGNLKIDL